jgi:hypothetical protein
MVLIGWKFVESAKTVGLFGWLVVDGWCWFVLREEYCWLVAGGWFVLREKYCWLVADKPNEQAVYCSEESGSVGRRSLVDGSVFGYEERHLQLSDLRIHLLFVSTGCCI